MTENPYDDIPYETEPLQNTHPDRTGALAALFGVEGVTLDGARVLELGCGSGNNLIPFAYSMPNATFLGIDLSETQVAAGSETVNRLGLSNVELRVQDLRDITAADGPFDFIIAHGLFSWVSPEIQERIFELCGTTLSDRGIAYISYNVLPGWYMRLAIRNMMLFHIEGVTDRAKRFAQARAICGFYQKAARRTPRPAQKAILEQLEFVMNFPDWYLAHDALEPTNEPLYFSDFMKRASLHGLQYVGDTETTKMTLQDFDSDIQETLRKIANDTVRFEQYLDFLRHEYFRRTILCKTNSTLTRDRAATRLPSLYLSSSLRPDVRPAELTTNRLDRFTSPNGGALETSDQALKRAVTRLMDAWPEALHCGDLVASIGAEGIEGFHPTALLRGLLQGYLGGLISAHVAPTVCAREAGVFPRVTDLVRLQAEKGNAVTTQLHVTAVLKPEEREAALRMDGTIAAAEFDPAMLRAFGEMGLLVPASRS